MLNALTQRSLREWQNKSRFNLREAVSPLILHNGRNAAFGAEGSIQGVLGMALFFSQAWRCSDGMLASAAFVQSGLCDGMA